MTQDLVETQFSDKATSDIRDNTNCSLIGVIWKKFFPYFDDILKDFDVNNKLD